MSKSVGSVVKSIVPKGVNMKHVLLAFLVGLLLCLMMGNKVEGYASGEGLADDTTGGKHCTARYIQTTGEGQCVPDGINQDASATDKHTAYCSLIAADMGCTPGELGEPSETLITGAGNAVVNGANDYNTSNTDSDRAASRSSDESGSVDENVGMTCKLVNTSDSCASLGETQCTNEANQDYCRWVDCNFSDKNPFASEFYNWNDWTTIQDWKKCLKNANPEDGGIDAQLDAVGIRSHDGNFDDNTSLYSGNTVKPQNAWGADVDISAKKGAFGTYSGSGVNLLDGSDTVNGDIFPNAWKQTLDRKIAACDSDETDGVIGWDNSQHNVKCLNYDSKVREVCYNAPVAERYTGCGCPCRGGEETCDRSEKECALGEVPSFADQFNDKDCGFAGAGADVGTAMLYRGVSEPVNFLADGGIAALNGLKKLVPQ